jgi:hypothetical protein
VYEHDTPEGEDFTVHTAVAQPHAQTLRKDRSGGPFTVTLGDTDLPAFLSDGVLCIQAPLRLLFEAFAEDFSAFLRDLEIRISDSRGTPFSLDCHGRPVSLPGLAEPRVVSNRRWRR